MPTQLLVHHKSRRNRATVSRHALRGKAMQLMLWILLCLNYEAQRRMRQRFCFAYKSVDYLSFVRLPPVCLTGCCQCPFFSQELALWYDIFQKVRNWTSLSPLSSSVYVCVCVGVFVFRHVYAHPCFPSVRIKSITGCQWHSGIWSPVGVVVWQSAAVDISHLGLLRFSPLVVVLLVSEFMTPNTHHYKGAEGHLRQTHTADISVGAAWSEKIVGWDSIPPERVCVCVWSYVCYNTCRLLIVVFTLSNYKGHFLFHPEAKQKFFILD